MAHASMITRDTAIIVAVPSTQRIERSTYAVWRRPLSRPRSPVRVTRVVRSRPIRTVHIYVDFYSHHVNVETRSDDGPLVHFRNHHHHRYCYRRHHHHHHQHGHRYCDLSLTYDTYVFGSLLANGICVDILLCTDVMARGQQKVQSQAKAAEKQAKLKKQQGHSANDQKKAAQKALVHVCVVCKVSIPSRRVPSAVFHSYGVLFGRPFMPTKSWSIITFIVHIELINLIAFRPVFIMEIYNNGYNWFFIHFRCDWSKL